MSDDASIIGLWQFAFSSVGNNVPPFNIPDTAPLDAGYAQVQAESFALSWDNTGKFCTPEAGAPSCFVGPANIREEIVLNRHGHSYTGSVTIDQYDPNNQWQFRLTGNVSAQRITAD